MPKLFISYRRKSWAFTHRLADELRTRLKADIFVDVDSLDQADFERSIVEHLRKSDVVLLVISETTFDDRIQRDDDWVRREIREALLYGIPIVLVRVEGLLPPPFGLPADIQDIVRMQGVEFYPAYFKAGVDHLCQFITRIEPKIQPLGQSLAPKESTTPFAPFEIPTKIGEINSEEPTKLSGKDTTFGVLIMKHPRSKRGNILDLGEEAVFRIKANNSNSEPIIEYVLKDGDEICIGNYVFVFKTVGDETQ